MLFGSTVLLHFFLTIVDGKSCAPFLTSLRFSVSVRGSRWLMMGAGCGGCRRYRYLSTALLIQRRRYNCRLDFAMLDFFRFLRLHAICCWYRPTVEPVLTCLLTTVPAVDQREGDFYFNGETSNSFPDACASWWLIPGTAHLTDVVCWRRKKWLRQQSSRNFVILLDITSQPAKAIMSAVNLIREMIAPCCCW